MSDQILATYLVEAPLAVERAAEMIAGEQSRRNFCLRQGRNR